MTRQDWYYADVAESAWVSLLSGTVVPWDSTGVPDPEPEPEPEPEPDDPNQPNPSVTHGTDLERNMVGLQGLGVDESELSASGQVTSSSDGQVIEGLHVDVSGTSSTGAIHVIHDNVTVRGCLVSHRQGRNGIVVASGASNCRVEYTDLHGRYRTSPTSNSGSIGVLMYGPGGTVFRSTFQGGRDGMHLYGFQTAAYENWVIDLYDMGSTHNDSVYLAGRSVESDIEVARNRVIAGSSGGIDAYSWQGPHINVRFFNNYVIGEGLGFGIYGGFAQIARDDNIHHDNRDFRIEGNRFSGTFGFPSSVGDGTNAAVNVAQPGNTFTDNRWLEGWGDHTVDLPARCGVRQDACESDWTT